MPRRQSSCEFYWRLAKHFRRLDQKYRFVWMNAVEELRKISLKFFLRTRNNEILIKRKGTATTWLDKASLTIEGTDSESAQTTVKFFAQSVVAWGNGVQTFCRIENFWSIRQLSRLNFEIRKRRFINFKKLKSRKRDKSTFAVEKPFSKRLIRLLLKPCCKMDSPSLGQLSTVSPNGEKKFEILISWSGVSVCPGLMYLGVR